MRRFWGYLLLVMTPLICVADVDREFQRALELGSDGDRREARKICEEILEEAPFYDDVRLYYARLLLWDGQLQEARYQFGRLLERDPENLDARLGRIDTALEAHHPREALKQCDAGLQHHPEQPELQYRRAIALEDLDRGPEALSAVRSALAVRPDWDAAKRLENRLAWRYSTYRFSAMATYENFDDIDDWYDLVLELQRQYRGGSVTGRVRLADRFDTSGQQYEIDWYPRTGPGYLYFNVGYSDASFFPEWRFGAEHFFLMSRRIEASIGARHLEFADESITLYTGSIGAYRGSWFFWLRPWFADTDSDADGTSATIGIRRYYGDVESHWSLLLGGGASTDSA